jgi:ATP-dependent DNA helicase RecG
MSEIDALLPRQLSLFDQPALYESADVEFKAAKGGLPGSMWETYSAFANTSGGSILLGVGETSAGGFDMHGVSDPDSLQSSLWNTLNNRQKVSANLLTAKDVEVLKSGAKSFLVIRVPRAGRRERPVYLNNRPFEETYRRDHSGDYRCSADEVRRMFADQSQEPADSRVLGHFGIVDLHQDSLRQYRNRMAAANPDHPWLAEDDLGLLSKLGGWRRERSTGNEGVTVAGLLMFGLGQSIRDPEALPNFHLDYRERLGEDVEQRWSDRLTADGTWEANLFQFYQRVLPRIVGTLKTPFQLDQNLYRVDDSAVSVGLREAVVNALIHADYSGQGGIVMDRYGDRIEMSNPGTLLLSPDQLVRGGVSECRNKALQAMFQLMGAGDKAGSGLDKIRSSWANARFSDPRLQETQRPDRVNLTLPLVTALPERALGELGQIFGEARVARLEPEEVHILVMALGEDRISNQMLQETLTKHRADLTKVLGSLVAGGFLIREGVGRWTQYVLHRGVSGATSGVTSGVSSEVSSEDGMGRPGDALTIQSPATFNGTIPRPERFSVAQWEDIKAVALARRAPRLPGLEVQSLIVDLLATAGELTRSELATLLDRNAAKLGDRFLNPLVDRGKLVMTLQPRHHPNQRYALAPKVGDG